MIWEIDDRAPAIEGVDAQGHADPAYAAALGLVAAPYGRRSLSFVIDLAIWVLLQVPLWVAALPLLLKLATGSISAYGLVNHPGFVVAVVVSAVSVVLMIVYAIVQWVLQGTKGTTIGKAITGLRSVEVRTLGKPGVGRVLLRLLIVGASGIVPVLGPVIVLLSPTYDPEQRGRGWHDRAARMWLVDARAGLNPYDEKRMRVARKAQKLERPREREQLPSLATSVNPAAAPEYRPGGRISAGVLGVARPSDGAQAARVAAPAPAAAPAAASASASAAPVAAPVARPEPPAPAPRSEAPAPAPAASAPAAAPVAAPTVWSLRLDSGESIGVNGPLLLGRDPDPAAVPGARAVSIPDETRSLSKTHAALRPAEGGLEIVDLHSTNGSALVRAGAEYDIPAGVPVLAAAGDVIRLGDRTAEVTRV